LNLKPAPRTVLIEAVMLEIGESARRPRARARDIIGAKNLV